MKIGLVKTYHCDDCQKYAYPHDIEIVWPDDSPAIWSLRDDVRIFVTYRCSCGRRTMRVPHVIDENNELFPHYRISKGNIS